MLSLPLVYIASHKDSSFACNRRQNVIQEVKTHLAGVPNVRLPLLIVLDAAKSCMVEAIVGDSLGRVVHHLVTAQETLTMMMPVEVQTPM